MTLTLSTSASAQTSLGLVCDTPLLDGRDLRAAVEQELKVPVKLLPQPNGPSLLVEAESLAAVHVRFVRMDQPSVERTVDVSAQAPQALTLIALLSANLARDEASELLSQLGAAPPPAPVAEPLPAAPAPPPVVAAAPPPAPAPVEPQPVRRSLKPPKPLNLGCLANDLRKVKVGADFVPYVGTSMRDGVEVERRISFNLIGGITGAVRGLELGGVFNIEAHNVCGAQLAGVFNYVQEHVSGVQLSMLNFAGGGVFGAQLGQVNIAGAHVYGAQVGEVNIAGSDVTGVQVGLVNISGGYHYGAQLGLANIIAGEARGLQLGLVNVSAKRDHGALLGLVNAAQNADVSIGLVNVLWHGRTQLDAWATDAGLLMLGFEHGARYSHNIYGFGIKPMAGSPAFSAAFGFGFRVLHAGILTVDVDALTYGLMRRNSERDRLDFASIHQLRVPFTFSFVRGVGLFIAPSVSVSMADSQSNLAGNLALYDSTRLIRDANSDWQLRLWPGLSIGLRFL